MADRRIHQLSGGEKQRVALARAFVTEPDVLLLDEPLGSLDENLRLAMEAELTDLHRRLGATFILVTHSQEEAITMSDRIVLMRGGRVEQQGAPADLFERPATRFAARFMGVENILDGHVRAAESGRVVLAVGDVTVSGTPLSGWRPSTGDPAFAAVRAEHVRLGASDAGLTGAALPGRVAGRVYKGKFEDWTVETGVGPVTGRVWDTAAGPPSVKVVGWLAERCIIGPAGEGVRH
jgi:ABC-type Fe3+/spermidine/putrescine transport system ATPase subunit